MLDEYSFTLPKFRAVSVRWKKDGATSQLLASAADLCVAIGKGISLHSLCPADNIGKTLSLSNTKAAVEPNQQRCNCLLLLSILSWTFGWSFGVPWCRVESTQLEEKPLAQLATAVVAPSVEHVYIESNATYKYIYFNDNIGRCVCLAKN